MLFQSCYSDHPSDKHTDPLSRTHKLAPPQFEIMMDINSFDNAAFEPLPFDNDINHNFFEDLFEGLEETTFLLNSIGRQLQDFSDMSDESDEETFLAALDPLPIGPGRVNIVKNVPLKDDFKKEDRVFFRETLSPLLPNEDEYSDFFVSSACLQIKQEKKAFLQVDSTDDSSFSSSSEKLSLRKHQSDQWQDRFEELVAFKNEHNHCLVPVNWQQNVSLALWVKRQRYQYRLKQEGKRSTLTDERQDQLERIGFVWHSRGIAWEDRYMELRAFYEMHGHCDISQYFPKTSQISIWVKCQRRQYKLFCEGKRSSITKERIMRLNLLGFKWNPRGMQRK